MVLQFHTKTTEGTSNEGGLKSRDGSGIGYTIMLGMKSGIYALIANGKHEYPTINFAPAAARKWTKAMCDTLMPKYLMTVTLEMTDEVEADTPEEAFEMLSNDAMAGGSWDYNYEIIDEEEWEEQE